MPISTNKLLAEKLFPNITETPETLEKRFPPRNLPENAEVTRIGPSPTGFIHLGNLYSAFADERLARRSGGRFYLRVEDTDDKRRVDGAVELLLSTLKYFGIAFDEGAETGGEYGPYYQRQREAIYQACAKRLVELGYAYPCFCTEDELSAVREAQTARNVNTGYYGEWAKCGKLSYDEILGLLDCGKPYTLRLRSRGTDGEKLPFRDEIMGDLELSANTQDIVLLKSDGIPTYHFAHVVDDHFMRTTTVIRGVEWLPSAPVHIELFGLLGFTPPKYAHTAQLMKIENGKKRKLSKRKDPELSLEYYRELGYHPEAVKIYMMTILNSNFEEWFAANGAEGIDAFPFALNRMGVSGILFDLMKLDDVSREFFAKKTPRFIAEFFREWLERYRPDELPKFFWEGGEPPEKLLKILALNLGHMENRVRKDIVSASQLYELIGYFYDDNFTSEETEQKPHRREILSDFIAGYDEADDSAVWFDKIKAIAEKYNYCAKTSQYKKNPDAYNGNTADVAGMLRAAVTGRRNTPDLWNILQILGRDEVEKRVQREA